MGNKRLRSMSWEDYGISKNRYKELKAFCLQYDEKKEKISYGLRASQGGGGGKFSTGSPTERQALNNAVYAKDIQIIEAAAVKVNKAIWQYILKSVTQDLAYEYIMYDEKLGKIPVGKTDFYAYRKLFYFFLDKMKLGTN